MSIYFLMLTSFFISSFLFYDPSGSQASYPEKKVAIQIARSEKREHQEVSKSEGERVIEEYEREKLAKFKRNIGKRYLVIRTVRQVEFHHRPEDPAKTFSIQKEKEGFLITEVVKNDSGTMYFYQVVFDSGQTGYLMAEGNYLEMRILEGCIVLLTGRESLKTKSSDLSKKSIHKAVELVKNHLIKIDPMTGQRMTVELRMREAKARFFPNLNWQYEVREIGNHRCRVIQYSEGEEKFSMIRTWVVDLSTLTVHPENRSAQTLYW